MKRKLATLLICTLALGMIGCKGKDSGHSHEAEDAASKVESAVSTDEKTNEKTFSYEELGINSDDYKTNVSITTTYTNANEEQMITNYQTAGDKEYIKIEYPLLDNTAYYYRDGADEYVKDEKGNQWYKIVDGDASIPTSYKDDATYYTDRAAGAVGVVTKETEKTYRVETDFYLDADNTDTVYTMNTTVSKASGRIIKVEYNDFESSTVVDIKKIKSIDMTDDLSTAAEISNADALEIMNGTGIVEDVMEEDLTVSVEDLKQFIDESHSKGTYDSESLQAILEMSMSEMNLTDEEKQEVMDYIKTVFEG